MNYSSKLLKQFRLRFCLSQQRMADLLGVQTRRINAWERGLAEPGRDAVTRLIDITRDLPDQLVASLATAVERTSGLPRALSRTARLELQAVSGPAIAKRPEIVDWIGRDLAPVATGVLQDVLADTALQRAIRNGDISRVVTTTRGVLETGGAPVTRIFRTTINYAFHDGILLSDAIAVPARDDERLGYTPIPFEELGEDLFGDHHLLEAGLMLREPAPQPRAG